MWLTHAAVKRPVAMAMFFLAIAFMGYTSYLKLPKQLFPDTDIPIITVTTVYAGASPSDVERLIGEEIEEAVSTISGVDDVQTTSREGVCWVIIQFDVGVDQDEAAADVRDKVSGVLGNLPDDAEQPIVAKFDMAASPTVIAGAVATGLADRELRTVADRAIKDRLSGAVGVASVSVGGGEVREIQIRVKQDRLSAVGLSLSEFRTWLTAQHLDLPGGSIKEGQKDLSVRVLGEFQTPDEIRQLTMKTATGGLVRLKDVADVADTVAEPETISRLNGQPSVTLMATKSSSANVIETAEAVKERLRELESELTGGVSFVITTDESEFAKDSLHDLVTSLIYGVLLATLVVFWFLRNIRSTLIIFFAIPTSLLATFFLMRLVGYTMNFMTMLGLALAVGILVDDSIVVLENIYRHLSMGKSPVQAAIDGRAEIGLAAVAITMTDVVVFVPIALMGGIVGKFFRPFGATVVFATLFSLLVSFTITPMLASRWLNRKDAAHGGGDEGDVGERAVRLRTPYVRVLDFSISRWGRWVTVGASVVLLVAVAGAILPGLGGNFFSDADQGEFTVYIELPIDKNIDATDVKTREVEALLTQYEEIKATVTEVGRSANSSGANLAQISVKCYPRAQKLPRLFASIRGLEYVKTKNKETGEVENQRIPHISEFVAQLQKELTVVSGATIRVRGASQGPGGGVNPIELELYGSREAGLIDYAERIRDRLLEEQGLADADMSYKAGRPEIQAKVNRARAAEFGITAAEIAMVVRTAVEGDTTLKYREASNEFDIRIELQGEDTRGAADIGQILVGVRNGRPLRLSDVADVVEGYGPVELTRKNRQDMITIGLDPGAISDQEANAMLLRIIEEVPPPAGVTTKVGGSVEMMQESFGYMIEALTLAIVLVFALLCMLYENWFQPLIIMTGVPMAVTGALIGLKTAKCGMDIFAMIGLIMLIGLVAKNAILLVDYTNTLRAQGYSRRDALLRAGPTRMRPIIMTTMTLVLSLLPISTGMGKGSEFRQPLGASVTGGVLFATYLTLVVAPALYTFMDDLQTLYVRVKSALAWWIFRVGPGEGGGETTEGP